MRETWTSCYDTDDYEVSNTGRIRNARTGRVLKTQIDKRGRERVVIYVNGMRRYKFVHKIVAEAFLKENLDDKDVYHIDCDKTNNRIDNLLVGERSNSIHNAKEHGLYESKRKKPLIVVETGKAYDSITECSKDIGINSTTISKCLNYEFYGNRGNLHFKSAH